MSKVKFKNWDCDTEEKFYGNGRVALRLVTDDELREPVATATVNLEEPLADGHVFIKNWSENEGMLDALVDAGIVKDTGKTVPTGFVEANICKYLKGE